MLMQLFVHRRWHHSIQMSRDFCVEMFEVMGQVAENKMPTMQSHYYILYVGAIDALEIINNPDYRLSTTPTEPQINDRNDLKRVF